MRNLKRYLVAVGLVAFVAFLVGCGGSSDKATNPTPTPPGQDEEQVTPTPKVLVGQVTQAEPDALE
jgi:hypothetical protein